MSDSGSTPREGSVYSSRRSSGGYVPSLHGRARAGSIWSCGDPGTGGGEARALGGGGRQRPPPLPGASQAFLTPTFRGPTELWCTDDTRRPEGLCSSVGTPSSELRGQLGVPPRSAADRLAMSVFPGREPTAVTCTRTRCPARARLGLHSSDGTGTCPQNVDTIRRHIVCPASAGASSCSEDVLNGRLSSSGHVWTETDAISGHTGVLLLQELPTGAQTVMLSVREGGRSSSPRGPQPPSAQCPGPQTMAKE
ncbi:hypothetical protein CB1_000235002 [Camelus ferus]|nr:hypothetical protein CB1_000235002 [Camelus ferus]